MASVKFFPPFVQERKDIGAKGYNLVQLANAGMPLPPFCAIEVKTFRDALRAALVSAELTTLTSRHQCLQVQEALRKISVPPQILEDLSQWTSQFPQGTKFSARSSGTREDSSTAAFAGMYSTSLNLPVSSLERGILSCWLSALDAKVLDYVEKTSFSLQDYFADLGMGVIIMVQIDSDTAGVGFSQDPTSNSSQCIIEAAFGQGEAVVDGLVVPDRWTISRKDDGSFFVQKFEPGNMTFELRPKASEGLERNAVASSKASCLTTSEALSIADILARLELKFGPCDIEWAIERGQIWLLQMRPITALLQQPKKAEWLAPGDGVWIYDSTHYPRRLSRMFDHVIPFIEKAWRESPCLVGSLLGGALVRMVNRVAYLNLYPCKDAPERFELCASYLKEHGWLKHWEEWSSQVVPSRVKLHKSLKKECSQMEHLSAPDFASHFKRILHHYSESFYYHHIYSFPYYTAMGWFMFRGSQLTSLSADELLLLITQTEEYYGFCDMNIVEALKQAFSSESARRVLQNAQGSVGLETLLNDTSPQVADAIRLWMHEYDHFVLSGLDASKPSYQELPDAMLRAICTIVFHQKSSPLATSGVSSLLEQTLLSLSESSSHRKEFEELLQEARLLSKWRDQRGLFNDVQAAGLLRITLKEAGRRISHSKPDFNWEWLLDCSGDEVLLLLDGGEDAPSIDALIGRTKLRMQFPVCPPFLNGEPTPPDLSKLPEKIREAEMSRGMFLDRLFATPMAESTKKNVIQGRTGNAGIIQGTARILLGPEDWKKIAPGDIAVVETTDSAFNAVLPFISGLVSDFGGTLSHVAVSAREYNIPCVVGTLKATQIVRDQDVIIVDGGAGQIAILNRDELN